MKKFSITCFNYHIYVYQKDELEDFEKDFKVKVEDELACVSGNGVYFRNPEKGVIFHEAIHLVDVLVQDKLEIPNLNLCDTTELRAYLTEYVGNKICKILGV